MTLEELYTLRKLLYKLEEEIDGKMMLAEDDESEQDVGYLEEYWEQVRAVDHYCSALVEDMGGDVDIQ